jgi:hypothetical protein
MARSILIILVVALIGGGLLYQRHRAQVTEQAIEEGLRDARRTFEDKAASIVTEDTDDYLSRIKAALDAYEGEVDDVYEGHEDMRDPDAYAEEVNRQLEEGQIEEASASSMLEAFELVKDAYDTLMQGAWTPVLTATGPGNIRIDIYDFDRTEDVEGNPVLQGKAFFWGIQENTRVSWGQLRLEYWYTAPPDKEMKRILRKQGKPVDEEVLQVMGRAEGDATPYIFLQAVDEYIPTVPAFVSVGIIRLPAMPQDAEKVDIEYGFTARKGGDAFDVIAKWDQLEIPSTWKLGEGEVWAADEIEATRDEILGIDPNADQPED